MFRVAILLFLLGTAAAEPVIVTVTRGGKPEGDAWVTWDRYGGGVRTLHGTDERGVARFEQRPGRITVSASHDRFGVVRKQVRIKPGVACRVTLNLDDARPRKCTLWVVDAATGRAVPDARFTLIRSGDGLEHNRPGASKADDDERVLGASVIPASVRATYDVLPRLFLHPARESDAQGRIVVEGLLPETMDGYVEAEGYAPQWIEGVGESRKVRLTRGGSVALSVDAPSPTLFCRLEPVDGFGVPAIIGAELDEQGKFVARNLPPGRYRAFLTSWYPGPSSSISWGSDSTTYIESAILDVAEGKQTACAVRLGPPHAVAGKWIAMELRRVLLSDADSKYEILIPHPFTFRKFEFPFVPAGEYELELRSEHRIEFVGRVVVDAQRGVRMPRLERRPIESLEVLLQGPDTAVGLWRLGEAEELRLPHFRGVGRHWFRVPKGRYVVRGWTGPIGFIRPIEVRAGESARLTLKPASTKTIAVSVRLLDPDGEPCEGTLEVAGFPLREVDPATRHDMRLPAGRYSIVAQARGCKTFRGSQIPVDTKHAPVEITIRFESRRPR